MLKGIPSLGLNICTKCGTLWRWTDAQILPGNPEGPAGPGYPPPGIPTGTQGRLKYAASVFDSGDL